jgi:putative SOS response-associated peptidase YedK
MPFAFAGIWDTWSNRGDEVTSCAIITTAANELVGELHDRMPAMLLHEFQNPWLDLKTDRTVLTGMLKPFPSLRMKTHPVSSLVNHPENDSAELLVRVEAEAGTTASLF